MLESTGSGVRWMEWVRRLQAVAQNGLHYAETRYDEERYRSVQAVAAEMLAAGTGAGMDAVRGLFDAQAGYATPKVDVRGAVFRDWRILLVREREDGGWTLPGGWADTHETPSEAVSREVREESGFETRPVRLAAVWDRTLHGHTPPHPFRIYKLCFLCELLGGAAKPNEETLEVDFFGENGIPPLSMGRTTPSQIAFLFDRLRNPDQPVHFD